MTERSGEKVVGRPVHPRGFTLLELVVALAIFAVMSVAAYSSLAAMVAVREQVKDEGKRLAEIQTAFRIIGRDIEQAAPRTVRDSYGDSLPAMMMAEGEGAPLEFTRNGWRNPAGRLRSSLERVAYRFVEHKLFRDSWQILDRGVDSRPFSRPLLTGVVDFEVSFIGADRQTSRVWPPEEAGGSAALLPRAVRVFVELEGWGRIERLYFIG